MSRLFYLLVLSSLFFLNVERFDNKRPVNVDSYVRNYSYLANTLFQSTGIPKPVIIAIAGLESNWGKSELATNANNHFGIKTKPEWTGRNYCKVTLEYEGWLPFYSSECFRSYPLISESYNDFGQFVMTRKNYQQVHNLPAWNYREWVEGLQDGGYATDPLYADKVLGIIWRYHLYELDKKK